MKRQTTEAWALRKLRALRLALLGAFLPIAALALLVQACAGDDEVAAPPDDRVSVTEAALLPFESCESLDEYLTEVATDALVRSYEYGYYYGGYGRGGGLGVPEPAFDDDMEESGPTDGGSAGGEGTSAPPAEPDDYTDTNVQEIGVDEPDLVKTDGQYLYVVESNYGVSTTLHIIDSWPADEAHEVATLALEGYGDTIFLLEDTLVAITSIYEGDYYYGGGGVEGRPTEPMPVDDTDSGGFEEGSSGGGSDGSTGTDAGEPSEGPDPDPDVPADEPTPDGGPSTVPGEPVEFFAGTRLSIVDISDRSNPSLITSYDIEGGLVNARMVDGIVYLISSGVYYDVPPGLYEALQSLDLPEPDYNWTEAEREAALAEVRSLVEPVIAEYVTEEGREAFIPDLRKNGENLGDAFACNDFMRPSRQAQLGVLSLLALDPTSDETPGGVALLANGWQVYGSLDSLYVAQDSRWWWWFDEEDPVTMTHVHRFALNGGKPTYQASGAVEGWVLNQFSMSEYDGHLRIATTDQTLGTFWGAPVDVDAGPADADAGSASTGSATTEPASPPETSSGDSAGSSTEGGEGSGSSGSTGGESSDGEVEPGGEGGGEVVPPDEGPPTDPPVLEDPPEEERGPDASNVFVLQQQGGELVVVGQVRGLAPGEQIFAVRFMGDRGYVVTFRQVDPLFTLDLSDPTNPAVVGELHITGFSTYLHPVGEDHLIGIGQEADLNGRVQGLQLQLFNVSDMSNPVRTHELEFTEQWSYSQAEHDHHAFTYYASRGVLAIPATTENWGGREGSEGYFSGLVLFSVSLEDGFEEIGRVSHTDLAAELYCNHPEYGYDCDESWEFPWYAWMQRSVFVDDFVYAISNLGVTASGIDVPEDILASIPFYSSDDI